MAFTQSQSVSNNPKPSIFFSETFVQSLLFVVYKDIYIQMQQGPLIVVYKEIYFERLTTKRPCCDLKTAFKVGLTIAAASLGGWVRARPVPGHHEDHEVCRDDDGDGDDIGDYGDDDG